MGLNKILEITKTWRDILFLDGRILAEKIRNKPSDRRTWWEKLYLWFHDNFEYIILVGGCIILALLLYSYLDNNTELTHANTNSSKKRKSIQSGGEDKPGQGAAETSAGASETSAGASETSAGASETSAGASETSASASESSASASEKSAANATFAPMTEREIKNRLRVEKSEKRAKEIAEGKSPTEKSTTQKMSDRFLLKKSKENIEAFKSTIKNAPGAIAGKISEKSGKAWKSIKSGEALSKGKEKFENVMGDTMNIAKQNSKLFYAFIFMVFMVLGFGLFFVPTVIMVVIGLATLMIFNKQKEVFLAST